MRCRHQWEIVSRTFNPPTSRQIEARGYSTHDALGFLYGITVVEQRCTLCGRTDIDHTPGKVDP